MSTTSVQFDREVIHASFRAASEEQDSLDAQLSESLAALAAYQSHLDGWQRQLAAERSELQLLREHTAREQAAAEANQSQLAAQVDAELATLRQTQSELDGDLQARSEEVRELNEQQAELDTELELARAKMSDLQSALDDQQRTIERERAQWAEESQQLHKLLEQRAEANQPTSVATAAEPPDLGPPRPTAGHRESPSSGAVLGSIVEQFGKLRQQRAMDRQGSKKTR